MWNDPDLDSHSRQSQRGGKKNDKAPKEDLTAFGYECLLFRNDGLSEAIEQGRMLITWQGLDPEDEDALWVDRYDARNLLDNTRYFLGPVELSENSGLDAPDLDEERFEDLDSEEEFMFDMDEDERDDYLAQKREQESESSYKGVHYDYDGTASLPVQEPTFRVHFDVPEGMSVPDTEKTLALIERTAKFVNSSSEPAMEAILQGKQATNPSFAFLSRRHHLFAFYKHIRWLMQTGLYEILEDYRQREADEAKAEEEDKLRQEANAVAEANEANKRTFPDIQKVIEKTVIFLATHREIPQFEQALCSMESSQFAFLNPGHPWHMFYLAKMNSLQKGMERSATPDEVSLNIDPSAVFLEEEARLEAGWGTDGEMRDSMLSIADHERASMTERIKEMRRLDRLQRVQELFQQRHKLAQSEKEQQDIETNSPHPGHPVSDDTAVSPTCTWKESPQRAQSPAMSCEN